MKNTFKHLVCIVLIMIAIFFISFVYADKTRTEYRTSYEEQPLVFVTKSGECYHSVGCCYLIQSKIPKGLEQARDSGFRCCSVCNGIASGTILVEVTEPYQVTDYTFAILSSLTRVFLFTPLICFPIYKIRNKNGIKLRFFSITYCFFIFCLLFIKKSLSVDRPFLFREIV